MLYQVVDGQDRPVSFMSHSFSASERSWSTFEQEAFAVVKAITHWDSLLLGHPFVVETDVSLSRIGASGSQPPGGQERQSDAIQSIFQKPL